MRDSMKRHLLPLPIVAAVILVVSGCSGSSSSNSVVPSPSATSTTETFSGSIGQSGATIYSFTVKNDGYVLLAGYTGISPASVTALGLGIGLWDATTSTCGLNVAQNDTSSLGSTAISATVGAGNYCLRVYAASNLSAGTTASYTVQVVHY